jgi:hypothetical protein
MMARGLKTYLYTLYHAQPASRASSSDHPFNDPAPSSAACRSVSFGDMVEPCIIRQLSALQTLLVQLPDGDRNRTTSDIRARMPELRS